MSGLLPPLWTVFTRLLCLWCSPGENPGVGHHALSWGSSQPRHWTSLSYSSALECPLSHSENWETPSSREETQSEWTCKNRFVNTKAYIADSLLVNGFRDMSVRVYVCVNGKTQKRDWKRRPRRGLRAGTKKSGDKGLKKDEMRKEHPHELGTMGSNPRYLLYLWAEYFISWDTFSVSKMGL